MSSTCPSGPEGRNSNLGLVGVPPFRSAKKPGSQDRTKLSKFRFSFGDTSARIRTSPTFRKFVENNPAAQGNHFFPIGGESAAQWLALLQSHRSPAICHGKFRSIPTSPRPGKTLPAPPSYMHKQWASKVLGIVRLIPKRSTGWKNQERYLFPNAPRWRPFHIGGHPALRYGKMRPIEKEVWGGTAEVLCVISLRISGNRLRESAPERCQLARGRWPQSCLCRCHHIGVRRY